MADFEFVGRHSITPIDFTVIDASAVPTNADGAVLAQFRNFATGAVVWSRNATSIGSGVYRLTISSAESGVPGLYYITWSYNLATIPQEGRTDVEVASSVSSTYLALSASFRSVVDQTWGLFSDLFDSAVGGPHLQMYAQSQFGRERVAQLLSQAMNILNTTSQPYQSYSTDPDSGFPFAEWGGLLTQATYIEVIKHLMRSYVEQPEVQGVSLARLDRRDYLQRWETILRMEMDTFTPMLGIYKMAAMNLGRSSILVGGGVFANYGPTMNPARGRQLPTFAGWKW